MPLIKDAPIKPFKRKEYRPWDLFGELDNTNPSPIPENKEADKNLGQTQDKVRTKLGQEIDVTQNDAKIVHTEIPKTLPSDKFITPDNEDKISHSSETCSTKEIVAAVETSDSIYKAETDDGSFLNLGQSQDKVKTNLGQSQDEPKKNLRQSHSKLRTKSGQRQDKVKTEPRTNLARITPLENFSSLIGLQRQIAICIYENCKLFREKITSPLSIEHIASSCKTSKLSIQKSIQRLENKGIIFREKFKNGRGGWTQYGLPEAVFQEILHGETQDKLRTKSGQSQDKVKTQPRTEPRTTASSSSSNYIKTTTSDLLAEWNFDITPYAKFGFTLTQLKQLASLDTISATQVEQSLIEFTYDFENKALPSIKTSKINFLMGLLRSGHTYVSEGYKNEQDAMILEMARRNTAKRESLLKAKFETWIEDLQEEQKQKLENKLPTHLTVLYRTYGMSFPEVREWLFGYYLSEYTNN